MVARSSFHLSWKPVLAVPRNWFRLGQVQLYLNSQECLALVCPQSSPSPAEHNADKTKYPVWEMFPVSNTFYMILGEKKTNKNRTTTTKTKSSSIQSAITPANLSRTQDSAGFAEWREKDYLVQVTPALVTSIFLEEHEELGEKEFFLITSKLH